MVENNKFIGCGFTRRVYDIGNGTVKKVAIKEDIKNGIIQNKNEFENYILSEKLNLNCFTEVISHNNDFSEIIVKKVNTDVPINDIFNDYFTKITLSDSSIMYLAASYGNKCFPLYFFGLEEFINIYISTFPKYDTYDIENLRNFCKNSNNVCLNKYFSFLNMSPRYDWIAKITLHILNNDDSISKALSDIIKFNITHPNRMVIADLWNSTQWGMFEDRLVVIDSGYSYDIQKEQSGKNFKILPKRFVNKINSPNEDFEHFNGKKIDEIKSPKGNGVIHKFFTSKGSEYILASDGMARRIKNAGLDDDGLWSWTSKTYFVEYDELVEMMDFYKNRKNPLRPIKIDYEEKELNLSSINDNGEWESIYKMHNVSENPELGKHTLEFIYSGKNILKRYHPGHDVSVIEF